MDSLFCTPQAASGCISVLLTIQLSCLAFLSIVFVQSGLDKVVDWKGNVEWLTGHFSKTFLAPFVKPMVASITVMEVGAGILCGVGAVSLLLTGSKAIGILGALLCSLTFLSLFFGQRVAKDYPGALGIVPYFLLTMATLYVLQ